MQNAHHHVCDISILCKLSGEAVSEVSCFLSVCFNINLSVSLRRWKLAFFGLFCCDVESVDHFIQFGFIIIVFRLMWADIRSWEKKNRFVFSGGGKNPPQTQLLIPLEHNS